MLHMHVCLCVCVHVVMYVFICLQATTKIDFCESSRKPDRYIFKDLFNDISNNCYISGRIMFSYALLICW